ncbi:hypothetical protein N665_0205s0030 [Sinapis alba]|nr:hypothetical protein N665_0205s0030 [Sinapis alba]
MPTFSAAALDGTLKEEKCVSQQPKPKTFTSLYATPKEIPLPYSSHSSPPSPYIVNHKARRPGLVLKSSSELDVPSLPETLSADVEATTTSSFSKSTSLSFPISEATSEDDTNCVPERPVWDSSPPPQGNFWDDTSACQIISNGGIGSTNTANCLAWESYLLESVRIKSNKEREPEDLYNRGQLVSLTSNTGVEDDAGAANSYTLSSAGGEFYDARDELSTESGTPSSVNNIEIELLRGMRLSLLMESEKRRQAEETLGQMQVLWRRLREQLAHVGLFVPLDPSSSMNIAEDEVRCQLEVTRFVSDSLDNGLTKAEEIESELEAKKFEITQLSDRLHYYETVNQEMSQRNQEAIEEDARVEKKKRKRRQRWIWGSIAASITLGGAVLAWPYPSGNSLTDVAQPQPPTNQ